jgi:hypothetical protein
MLLPELLLLAFLPGALLYRVPAWDRDRRAGLSAEERGFWAVVLSVAWSCSVTLVLAALESYRFERLLAANLGASLALVLVFRTRLLYRGRAPRPTAVASIPCLLVVVCLWLFFPPAEWVTGGKDPGIYVSEGILIAQRGGLVVHDALVRSIPHRLWDLFVPSYNSRLYYSLRFMGFFLLDPRSGDVVGQFPHLFPASMAIGYGLQGLKGGLGATGMWAITGVLGTYFLGARLFGRTTAACSAWLLALNVTQVWFARSPNSEILTQALTTAALLAAARALVDGDRFFAPVAGALLGLMLFARFDAALPAAGVMAAVALAPLAKQRMGVWFWAALVPVAGLAVRYFATILKPYGDYPLGFVRNEGGPFVALAVIAGALLIRFVARAERVRTSLARAVPLGGAAGVVALAVYAYWFREPGGRLAAHDAAAFRTFAWYVTSPGLLLAVAGFGAFIWRRFWRDPGFVLAVGAASVFVFYKVRIVPEHFWLARRFLPVILPASVLFAVGLWSVRLWERSDGPPEARRLPARVRAGLTAAGLAVTLGLTALFWRQTQPILSHVEYAGLASKVEHLANLIGDQDLVIVESRSASDLHVVALPLAYIYGKQVLVFTSPRPDKALLEGFLDWARQQFPNVYFLGGGGTDLLSRQIAVAPVAGDWFHVPEWDAPRNRYPSGMRLRDFDYGLYRFVEAKPPTGRFDLKIGVRDDVYVIRFHGKERHAESDEPYRWTRDASYVALPGLLDTSRQVTLWLSNGGRPASLGPCVVRVSLDDHPLGEVTVGLALESHSFVIPPEVARRAAARTDPALLAIRTSTWTAIDDPRKLGVIVGRVEVR